MVRDLLGVAHGEPVTIYAGTAIFAAGIYRGVENDHIVVDSPRLGTVTVDIDSQHFDVVDAQGRCLGLVVDDPDLRGAVPELE